MPPLRQQGSGTELVSVLRDYLKEERLNRVFMKETSMSGTRKMIDCRRFPTEKPCTIAISGTEEEVLDLAVLHAINVHGHADTAALHQQIRSMLTEERAAAA